MATVSVRYIVHDVDAAITFYCEHLGFSEQMHPAPAFAMLSRGDLRLVLNAPGGGWRSGHARRHDARTWRLEPVLPGSAGPGGDRRRAADGRSALPQRHRHQPPGFIIDLLAGK